MKSDPQQQKKMHQNAVIRFYSLVAVLITACIFALGAIVSLPGLHNPETGTLPKTAWYALMALPLGLYISFAVALLSSSSRSNEVNDKMDWVHTIAPIGGTLLTWMILFALGATNL